MHKVKAFGRHCLTLCVLSQACLGAQMSGIVRTVLTNGVPSEPEKIPPPPASSVTLCSKERVYRVQCDNQGRFTLQKIEPGTYDLIAVARAFDPELIATLKVVGDHSVGPIVAIVHAGRRSINCYVSTGGENMLRDFDVDYRPADSNRSAPVIQGQAQRYVHEHREGKAYVAKRLPHARIQLFRKGEAAPVLSTTSGRQGAFTLTPEPGIYELLMTYSGLYDVRTPAFLVPRENVTLIELRAATEGDIVIQR
jgi:hypothetical protein